MAGCRLCDTEVYYLDKWLTVVDSRQNIRRFDVPVDYPFLMRVLNGLANLDEQFQSLLHRQFVFIAVIGDANSTHQLHDKKWSSPLSGASVKYLGDVRML